MGDSQPSARRRGRPQMGSEIAGGARQQASPGLLRLLRPPSGPSRAVQAPHFVDRYLFSVAGRAER